MRPCGNQSHAAPLQSNLWLLMAWPHPCSFGISSTGRVNERACNIYHVKWFSVWIPTYFHYIYEMYVCDCLSMPKSKVISERQVSYPLYVSGARAFNKNRRNYSLSAENTVFQWKWLLSFIGANTSDRFYQQIQVERALVLWARIFNFIHIMVWPGMYLLILAIVQRRCH